MLVFPQLSTGASSVYPITKSSRFRTAVNELGDGSKDIFEDADAESTAWELRAQGLTSVEWNAIDTLFQVVAGRWGTFTFLDPAGNLLAQSENFAASEWTNGPALHFTAGVADPTGGTGATTAVNTGAAVQSVAQTLAIPGNFQYVFSVWARTSGGTGVTLSIAAGTTASTRAFTLGTTWRFISLAANLQQTSAAVTFSVLLAPGVTVDLFATQAEAQLAPSDYKQTGARNAVYSNARFAEDTLTVTARGTDIFDTVIRIVNMEN